MLQSILENENFKVYSKNKIISISKLLHNCDKGDNMCVGIYNYIHNSEVERFLWKNISNGKTRRCTTCLHWEIVARFEKKGFQLVGAKLMQVTPEIAGQHYAEHKENLSLVS